jgi:hypothetical protein
MRHLAKRLAGAVASAFGRRIEPRQDFPLERLAQDTRLWIVVLQRAMQLTQRGCRQPSFKRRPPKGAAKWRGERRPDKVAAAERNAKNPVFTGKLNYRRSEPRQLELL